MPKASSVARWVMDDVTARRPGSLRAMAKTPRPKRPSQILAQNSVSTSRRRWRRVRYPMAEATDVAPVRKNRKSDNPGTMLGLGSLHTKSQIQPKPDTPDTSIPAHAAAEPTERYFSALDKRSSSGLRAAACSSRAKSLSEVNAGPRSAWLNPSDNKRRALAIKEAGGGTVSPNSSTPPAAPPP